MNPFHLIPTPPFTPTHWGLTSENLRVIVDNLARLREIDANEVVKFKIYHEGAWEDLDEVHCRIIKGAFLAGSFSVTVEDMVGGTVFYDLIRLCAINLGTNVVSPIGFRVGIRWFSWPEFEGHEEAIAPGDTPGDTPGGVVLKRVVLEPDIQEPVLLEVTVPDIEALVSVNGLSSSSCTNLQLCYQFFKDGKISKNELLEIIKNAYGAVSYDSRLRTIQAERQFRLSSSVATTCNATVSQEVSQEPQEPTLREIENMVNVRRLGIPSATYDTMQGYYRRFLDKEIRKADMLEFMVRLFGRYFYLQILEEVRSNEPAFKLFGYPVPRAKRGREEDK